MCLSFYSFREKLSFTLGNNGKWLRLDRIDPIKDWTFKYMKNPDKYILESLTRNDFKRDNEKNQN